MGTISPLNTIIDSSTITYYSNSKAKNQHLWKKYHLIEISKLHFFWILALMQNSARVLINYLLRMSKRGTGWLLVKPFIPDYWLRWGEDLTSLLTSLFLRGLRWGSSISFDARNEVRSSIFLWGWGKKSSLTFPQFKHEKCWKN